MSRQTMSVAIVIPTYNEVENIGILLGEIKKNVPTDVDYEIVVVDDNSPDGTWKKAVELLENNIFVVRRIGLKGLSTAVIDGIIFSSKDYALVLDADLQHPPEYIKDMIFEAQKTNVDVVIGSRYTKGGGVAGWSKTRLLISKTATLIAKLFLPSVRRISDPMSGFFMVKRRIVLENLSKLNPYGFKILLDAILDSIDYAEVLYDGAGFEAPRLFTRLPQNFRTFNSLKNSLKRGRKDVKGLFRVTPVGLCLFTLAKRGDKSDDVPYVDICREFVYNVEMSLIHEEIEVDNVWGVRGYE